MKIERNERLLKQESKGNLDKEKENTLRDIEKLTKRRVAKAKEYSQALHKIWEVFGG